MSSTNRPTRHSVLGTLVDRSICMPYAKPQVIRRGHRRLRDEENGAWTTVASIREDVAAAAGFLHTSFEATDGTQEWSAAELAADPAGPWWSKPRDDFFALDSHDRDWVLDRLEETAHRAAACLEDEAVDRGWSWIWSQPSFAQPGKVRPTITRPDIVAGLDWKHCDLIDLKTSSQDELSRAVKPAQKKAFASWTASMRALRFCPERCLALVVSTETDAWEWVESPVPESAADGH